MKLDKTRPYGTCSGEGGAVFEQDGALFDVHGDPVVAAAQAQPEKGKPGRKPKSAADDQLAAQLGG